MEWLVVIALLLLGIGLIIAEVIFIPGTTFVGVIGFVCLISGIYSAYSSFGSKTGMMIMVGSGIVLVIAIIYGLKAKTWEVISLKDEIKAKAFDDLDVSIVEGCVAISVSDMRPMGTIEFENGQYEATTNGEHISAGQKVKVIRVVNNEIVVEKVKQ